VTGLPVIERFELGKLVGIFHDEIADAPDQLAALGRRHRRPRPGLERAPRGLPRAIDVLLVALGHPGHDLTGCRIGDLERLPETAGTHLPSTKSCLVLAMKLPAARESPAISFCGVLISVLMASVSKFR